MNLPYNNGKVSIGSAYYLNPLKPKYIEQDPDMLLIQKHLIYDPELIKRQYWTTRIIEYFGIIVLFVVLLKGYFA
jgi:hypothetical protein